MERILTFANPLLLVLLVIVVGFSYVRTGYIVLRRGAGTPAAGVDKAAVYVLLALGLTLPIVFGLAIQFQSTFWWIAYPPLPERANW